MHTLNLLWMGDHGCAANVEHDDPHGFDVTRVTTLDDAAQALETSQIDSVLVTSEGTGGDYLRILEALLHTDASVPVVFWARGLTAADAVRLIRNGCHHCFERPGDEEAVWDCVTTAAEDNRLRKQVTERHRKPEEWRNLLVGESRAMQDVVNTIRLVGPRRCTVLIAGETGTGKEMAARALHGASPRAAFPMVSINCSALPENLLEAELFGYVKGAFTGASTQRIGRFEQSHRSTLLLDEISEMPLDLQAKLLRVLQEREFQRVGSSETIRVDIRVVAASNASLEDRVRQGRFREDLFYRLNVVPLQMPPLRTRRDDIPSLVSHFVSKVCRAEGIPERRIAPEAMERLTEQPWPGNVRHLENSVEMAIALSGEREILTAGDFGLARTNLRVMPVEAASIPMPSEIVNFASAVSSFERSILESALARTNGNKTAAADLLGLKRTTLIMKLRALQEAPALESVAG